MCCSVRVYSEERLWGARSRPLAPQERVQYGVRLGDVITGFGEDTVDNETDLCPAGAGFPIGAAWHSVRSPSSLLPTWVYQRSIHFAIDLYHVNNAGR